MVENIKELEKLLKLCRKQGVTDITWGSVTLKLGDLPGVMNATADEEEASDPYANFPDGPLSPEELTFFANGGLPDENPYRQQ